MRYVKAILILLLIIAIFSLIGTGYHFWGIFLLFVLITYIYNTEIRKTNKEFNWIAASLLDDSKLKDCRESKVLYHFALDCLYDRKIKKGMSVEEFARVLLSKSKDTGIKLVTINSTFLKNRSEGLIKYDKDKENYTLVYLDYGFEMPTPELRFKFRKGNLVKIGRNI